MPEPIQETEVIKFEYQHTDDSGNPIMDPRTGKQMFTIFTGKDWQEIAEKQKESYLHASRTIARLRSAKPVPKEAEPAARVLDPEEQRKLTADLQDPTKSVEAIRKLAGVDQIDEDRKAARQAKDAADAQRAAFQFMSSHVGDYFPCTANSAILTKFINDNSLDPRVADNYEIAFNAVEGQLAQRPAPAAPPAEIPQPPMRTANGGIQPGQLSGSRPIPVPKEQQLREDIRRMRSTPAGREEFKRKLKDPAFVASVNALGQT